jgi:hypothetical protein
METKWIAIAVAVTMSSLYFGMAIMTSSDNEVRVACFKAAEAMANTKQPLAEFKVDCKSIK